MNKLRRDSLWMGLILGLALPAVVFGIICGILSLLFYASTKMHGLSIFDVISVQKLILLSVVPNLFLLRYYLLKLKFDLTGRGILTITFIIGIVFAILEFI
ncbi:MAG TPA: hypothetical protein PK548_01760 [Bacteroidales bacterium]|jgi:hypothetical protein|nr:hypothetical protein [Bacteroidales bacterium]HQA86130.1 hypothetical protein [Bacteroidales bacterium]